MTHYINPPPQGPLSRIIAAIFAVLMLVGAFMIGMVALLFIAGAGLIAGLAIWLRVIWIKRQLRKNGVDLGAGKKPTTAGAAKETGHVIEAEYTVISEREE